MLPSKTEDLVQNLLRLNPKARILAQEGLAHKYFSSLPTEVHTIQDSEYFYYCYNTATTKTTTTTATASYCYK